MYKISFTDIDRSLLKANKALKSKKGHSLFEAESQLNEAKKAMADTVTVTIVLMDVEKGLDYIFENVRINDVSPDLMQILESEITSSGHEDGHRLINDIEKSYQDEISSQNSRSKVKKGNVLGFFKSKREKDGSENKESIVNVEDDFAELEQTINVQDDFAEITSEPVVEESDPEEFQELPVPDKMDYQFVNVEQYEEENESVEEPITSEFDEYNPDVEQEDIPYDGSFNEEEVEPTEIDEDFQEETESESSYRNNSKELKHERVHFPAYNSFLDLSAVDSTISRFKERFEKNHLVKFLGLNALSTDTIVTDLDAIKLNYAMNALDESEFVLIKDFFHNSIENIRDKTQTQLTQVYEKAMMFDYEEEATKSLQDDFSSILEKSEVSFNEYEIEQEQEYNLKLEKYDHEQEKALEEFKRKQALERSIYVQDLDAKKSSRLAVYIDDMQNNLTHKREELIDNKMFELKYQSINELTETKRLAIRNFENQLDSAMDDVWDNLQSALKILKDDIQERIPTWQIEVKEKHKNEAEKREEARKEEELKLERERIELQRRQLEKSDEVEKKDQDTVSNIERKLEDSLNHLTNLVTQSQSSQQPMMNSVPLVSQANQQDNDSKNSTNKALIVGVAAALLLGGGTLLGKSLVSADVEPASAKSEHYEELATSISSLEEKFNLTNVHNPDGAEKTLEDLINEKNYEQALKEFNDKDSLNAIETALFKDKDLEALSSFNETNKSMFGELDAAILSGDAKKVVGIYDALKKNEKKALTDNRKEEIALLLYQSGESELADKVVGVNKEKKDK